MFGFDLRQAQVESAGLALILVAEHSGPTMFARIGMMRALNRHVKCVFDSSRNRDTLGTPKAGAGSMTDVVRSWISLNATSSYDFLGRPKPKNFSKNRPEVRILNHQYENRRDCMIFLPKRH
jgi:hypothetical protein